MKTRRFNIRSVESCTAALVCAVLALMLSVVSIFALSNRVLLLGFEVLRLFLYVCFNIRSVESCTAARRLASMYTVQFRVSIFALSNRVLLPPGNAAEAAVVYGVSIFALSNRVLLPRAKPGLSES